MNKQEIEKIWKIADKPNHQMKDACWVKVIVEILQVETGVVAKYQTEEIFNYGECYPSTFNWAENNFSCDCNRQLFFYRAFGEEDKDTESCTEGNYLVRLINLANGEIYYDEFPFSRIN